MPYDLINEGLACPNDPLSCAAFEGLCRACITRHTIGLHDAAWKVYLSLYGR